MEVVRVGLVVPLVFPFAGRALVWIPLGRSVDDQHGRAPDCVSDVLALSSVSLASPPPPVLFRFHGSGMASYALLTAESSLPSLTIMLGARLGSPSLFFLVLCAGDGHLTFFPLRPVELSCAFSWLTTDCWRVIDFQQHEYAVL